MHGLRLGLGRPELDELVNESRYGKRCGCSPESPDE